MSTNQSIERGFALLELLDGCEDGLGIREMARQLALHPSNVQRLANTLSGLGYVEVDPQTKRYRLSYKALFLGQSLISKDRLISAADLQLSRLGRQFELSSYLAVLRGSKAVYLLAAQGRGLVTVRVAAGDSAHLHTSAMGKALLTGLSDDEIRNLLGSSPLAIATKNTITTMDALLAEVKTSRMRGYSVSIEENYYGILSVGAPVQDYSGAVIAAISVALPMPSDPVSRIESLRPHVMEAAAEISRSVGANWRGSRAAE